MRPSRHDEGGTITLWMLGLSIVLLFLGGLSIDLWRAFTERRDLASAVDAAAAAGTSALDESAFREDSTVALDLPQAFAQACRHLLDTTSPLEGCAGIRVSRDLVEVTASRDVPFALVKVLLPNEPPLRIAVTARAQPHRSP